MADSPPPVISFARGVPSADLLPVDELRSAIARAMEKDPTGMLLYGDPMGYMPLRAWVGERWGFDPAGVFVTNGSLQGFALLAEMLFAGSGGRAVVEAPTYDRTILTLKRFGATVDAYPLLEDGIDVDALEAAIKGGKAPGLVYIIPNFQNPAGNVTTLAVRQRDRCARSEPGEVGRLQVPVQRLLQPEDVVGLDRAREAHALLQRIGRVHVEHEQHVGPDRPAGRGDALQFIRHRHAAALELHATEAVGHRARRLRRRPGPVFAGDHEQDARILLKGLGHAGASGR